MEQKKQTIDELTEEFHRYLRSIRRSERTIRLYLATWGKLKGYMASRQQKIYSGKIGEAFLVSELGTYKFEDLPINQQNFVSKIEALVDFQNAGRVLLGMRTKPPRIFAGAIGNTIKAFIDFRTSVYNLAPVTANNYEIYLHSFLCFLGDRGIDTASKITQIEILQFVGQLNPAKPAARHVALYILRNYAKYLYEKGLVNVNYSSYAI